MTTVSRQAREKNKSVGFVPTMGYLHQGHLSLIRKARNENDFLIVSIYVNPTQFGQGEDFNEYPRSKAKDIELCRREKADVVFAPEDKDMYPESFQTFISNEGNLSKNLCGLMRPGHFKGVCTVVDKLFNIVEPHTAYFGQKDFQQARIIEQMVKDLNKSIKIKILPIVRADDGLALSSRNEYLTSEERKKATVLYQSLKEAEKMIRSGIKDAELIKRKIRDLMKGRKVKKIDYIEIVDALALEKADRIKGEVLVALAVWIGKTRLIDNILIESKKEK
jgi:pantoate--beta-alanine ligase